MSKLDGNERWKTKMLLTEHKEQYEQRHQPKIIGMPTNDEMTMIRDYIMYPNIISMLHRSIDQIRTANIPLKELLARCLEVIMFSVTDDYYILKRDLKTRNIQVFTDTTDDGVFYHRYLCRGYENRFGITREALKAEMGNRLARYTDQLSQKLKRSGGNEDGESKSEKTH
ncbi:hypothetical protein ACX93W_05095 [Paenibacillus sp. CAU 1782]